MEEQLTDDSTVPAKGSLERTGVRRLRIHGDNIVECDRALQLLVQATQASTVKWIDSPLYAPIFEIANSARLVSYQVQLFPGYGRWGAEIEEELERRGAPLAEAADAILTEIIPNHKEGTEHLLLAIEFCGALPAGNNAWQRCGRSYSYAITGVPYLYYSELGGQELTALRLKKSARLPNPLVPFAYVSQSQLSSTFALPVFGPSPSIGAVLEQSYRWLFGEEEALFLINGLLCGEPLLAHIQILERKGLDVASQIAAGRRSKGELHGDMWAEFLSRKDSGRANFVANLRERWSKRVTIPTTASFRMLLTATETVAVSAGSSDMPFCIVPAGSKNQFESCLTGIYAQVSPETRNCIDELLRTEVYPIVVVFMAGFKPRGDDSRPDRGLLPLVRMIYGELTEVLTVIYGPGKPAMWNALQRTPAELEKSNGLWQSVLRLSDIVWVDSLNVARPFGFRTRRKLITNIPKTKLEIRATRAIPKYSEHDVDTTIKMLAASDDNSIFEGLCNPPGGDWSGISLVDIELETEYRWTSLPRVTGTNGKRPDHILQFPEVANPNLILSIESKDRMSDFEENIGPRLKKYVRDLVKTTANISRTGRSTSWAENTGVMLTKFNLISGGAFISSESTRIIARNARKNQLDLAFAVSFANPEQTFIKLIFNEAAAPVAQILSHSSRRLGGRIVIQEYALEDFI